MVVAGVVLLTIGLKKSKTNVNEKYVSVFEEVEIENNESKETE